MLDMDLCQKIKSNLTLVRNINSKRNETSIKTFTEGTGGKEVSRCYRLYSRRKRGIACAPLKPGSDSGGDPLERMHRHRTKRSKFRLTRKKALEKGGKLVGATGKNQKENQSASNQSMANH